MKFHKSPIEGINVVSNDPFLGIIDDFLDDKEIKGVVDLVKDELKPSLTVDKKTGEYTVSKTRTSHSATLPKHATLVQNIAEKCSTYSGYDKEQLEELQVVHYEKGQKFDFHHDSNPPLNRICTILVYLNDVEDYEGLTTFPYVGYAVAPKKGRAVIWYNFKDNGEYDIRAGHVGSPVTKGEKWALNIWIKENELKNSKEIDKKFIESEHKKYPPKKKLELIP